MIQQRNHLISEQFCARATLYISLANHVSLSFLVILLKQTLNWTELKSYVWPIFIEIINFISVVPLLEVKSVQTGVMSARKPDAHSGISVYIRN